jgi:hypothetical protein
MIRPMKYHRIDIQSKVFDGANYLPTLSRLLKNYANITRTDNYPVLVIPRPNKKEDCSYCVELLGTLKYDRIDIQSKVFDGANCIPTLYRLLKNYANITRTDN